MCVCVNICARAKAPRRGAGLAGVRNSKEAGAAGAERTGERGRR